MDGRQAAPRRVVLSLSSARLGAFQRSTGGWIESDLPG